MATWESKRKFTFEDQHKNYDKGTADYFEWEYGTCADALMITETQVPGRCAYGMGEHPGRTETRSCGQEEAKALYQTLRHWIGRYCGDHVLEELDKEVSNG